ncbi:Uncharacterised protein [Vibrio cholerae]|nr:Uncharacterised protein [Vibrio cholerae]
MVTIARSTERLAISLITKLLLASRSKRKRHRLVFWFT